MLNYQRVSDHFPARVKPHSFSTSPGALCAQGEAKAPVGIVVLQVFLGEFQKKENHWENLKRKAIPFGKLT